VIRGAGRSFFFFDEFLFGRASGVEPSFCGYAELGLGLAGNPGPDIPVPISKLKLGSGSRRPAAAKPCDMPAVMRGGGLHFFFLEFILAIGIKTLSVAAVVAAVEVEVSSCGEVGLLLLAVDSRGDARVASVT